MQKPGLLKADYDACDVRRERGIQRRDANYRCQKHTSENGAIELQKGFFPPLQPSRRSRNDHCAAGTSGWVQAVSNSPSTLPFTFGFEDTILART